MNWDWIVIAVALAAVVAAGIGIGIARRKRLELPKTPPPPPPEASQPAAPEAVPSPVERETTQQIVLEEEQIESAETIEVPVRRRTTIPPPAPAADPAAFRAGLKSTRGNLISRLAGIFRKGRELDTAVLDEVEEVLITADVGVHTTEKILDGLRSKMEAGALGSPDQAWDVLREEAREILASSGQGVKIGERPTVILVVGVNGVGKTTTIGKLASRLSRQDKKVMLAAGDTFRAAAVTQLEVWGRRVECEVVRGKDRADPGSVIFDAIEKAKEAGADVLIADTAGRLHTKAPLMEELRKVGRTVEKALGRPADHVLLVLDATTGQNAIQQAELFKEALPLSARRALSRCQPTLSLRGPAGPAEPDRSHRAAVVSGSSCRAAFVPSAC